MSSSRPSKASPLPAEDSISPDSPGALARQAVRYALDRVPLSFRQHIQKARGKSGPRLIPLERLDAELAEADRRFAESEDSARSFLNGFALMRPTDTPADPFSDVYQAWTWDLYRRVSGRSEYSTDNEHSPFDLDAAAARPYPYATGSPKVVGEELMARGFIIKALGLTPPGRIVEFGPGWSNLTLDLATMGFSVTGVEVEPLFSALATERTRVPHNLEMVCSDMLAFQPSAPYDAAIFYESFHHCADHRRMLRQLHDIVRPGGVLLFAAEPVEAMTYPWGPRLDGYSLWSTRRHGWLELGFDTRYFTDVLARTGWAAKRLSARSFTPLGDLWLASART